MPMYHVFTLGSDDPTAAGATPGGGGYNLRRKRWLYACGIVLLLVLL